MISTPRIVIVYYCFILKTFFSLVSCLTTCTRLVILAKNFNFRAMPTKKTKYKKQAEFIRFQPESSPDSTSSHVKPNNSQRQPRVTPAKLKDDMAKEQEQLAQELTDYIAQFEHKVSLLRHKRPSDQELVILFVMNLHSRWKRLVEPEEYRFKTWKEAAAAARFHAIKLSVILGAERNDSDPMFTTAASKQLLASGYFKREHEPEEPEDDEEDEEEPVEEQPVDPKLTCTERRGPVVVPQGADKNSICYQVPKAHSGVSLAFLELEIGGRRVRALLAKKRWGASAMSVALQEDTGLALDRSQGYNIATEFGEVADGIGAVLCPIRHPAKPDLQSELLIQVVPALYAGKVDLILGADFFFYFAASFDVDKRIVRFMGADAPFVVDTL
ncbi:hypothetical protein BJV82DRAFT_128709 [Fennellomyces sp. T-0311]|nr:hypothetical protein BJV82DRAFT_128709 [Fennellomyces sp. T-0311]